MEMQNNTAKVDFMMPQLGNLAQDARAPKVYPARGPAIAMHLAHEELHDLNCTKTEAGSSRSQSNTIRFMPLARLAH